MRLSYRLRQWPLLPCRLFPPPFYKHIITLFNNISNRGLMTVYKVDQRRLTLAIGLESIIDSDSAGAEDTIAIVPSIDLRPSNILDGNPRLVAVVIIFVTRALGHAKGHYIVGSDRPSDLIVATSNFTLSATGIPQPNV